MNLQELAQNITSGKAPTWILVAGGILALLLAFKVLKGLFKLILFLAGLALLLGGVWWYFHPG